MFAKREDKLIDPSTNKAYVVTEVVFDGHYLILKELDGDNEILMSREVLKGWRCKKKNG